MQLIFPPPPSSAAVIIAALHILNGYPLRLPAAGDLGTHRVIEVRSQATAVHVHAGPATPSTSAGCIASGLNSRDLSVILPLLGAGHEECIRAADEPGGPGP